MKHKVICLCGSTRYKQQFEQINADLTLAGNVVLSVGYFHHVENRDIDIAAAKILLDDIHKQKIDMSDEVFVINPDGYIGESTRSEIKHAMQTGKHVKFLVSLSDDELNALYKSL